MVVIQEKCKCGAEMYQGHLDGHSRCSVLVKKERKVLEEEFNEEVKKSERLDTF